MLVTSVMERIAKNWSDWIDIKTIGKYRNEYQELESKITNLKNDKTLNIQEKICKKTKYNSKGRKPRKYTEEIDNKLDEILEGEIKKTKELGFKKQRLTNLQIHKIIEDAGFDIGYTTISNKIKMKRNKSKECFIK